MVPLMPWFLWRHGAIEAWTAQFVDCLCVRLCWLSSSIMQNVDLIADVIDWTCLFSIIAKYASKCCVMFALVAGVDAWQSAGLPMVPADS